MKQVPDSLLAFQHMFPDDDACAAWLIEMRWPDGFVCPACGHEKGWALRRKAHTFECAGCRRQTSVTAGTILHASKLPLTVLVLGRLPDGDPLQRHLCPCSSRNSSVSALTAALGCSPTSCAPAWSTPSATRCRAWWKSTRPAFHSGPMLRCSHRRARTQPDGKMLIVGAIELGDGFGWPKSPPTAPADLGHFVETAADPDAIAKTDGWSGYAVPADRHNVHVGRPPLTSSCDPPSLLQRMGASLPASHLQAYRR